MDVEGLVGPTLPAVAPPAENGGMDVSSLSEKKTEDAALVASTIVKVGEGRWSRAEALTAANLLVSMAAVD
eukprot:3677200-Amphidinium_carterae.1